MIQGKNILMVIAAGKFRDEELFHTRAAIEQSGGKVTIASTTLEPVIGMLGAKVNADILLSKADVSQYDAIVFVGGIGAQQYFNDMTAHSLARKAIEKGKVVAAICIAPSILANAGLLQGKNATVFPSEKNNLLRSGAKYTAEPVTIDGNIITAEGPTAAKKFGEAIALRLKGK